MTERPWLKFYPSDWRSDEKLRVCSLAARGLWIECLCVMHSAKPYGYLTINGRPVTEAQLAALAGADLSTVREAMNELEAAGVFSRDRNGTVYSRRMARDEKKRRDGEKAAKTGRLPHSRRGRQAAEKERESPPPSRVVKGVVDTPPSPQRPEARGQSLDNNPPPSPSERGSPKGDRASRLPGDFIIPDEWIVEAAASRERHCLPAANLRLEAERFVDYWRAQSGQKGRKLDWRATWRVWALRADGARSPPGGGVIDFDAIKRAAGEA